LKLNNSLFVIERARPHRGKYEMKAISVEELSKTFSGGTVAVDEIGFSLDKGEIFGFLGPNGAGKTTTVKLL